MSTEFLAYPESMTVEEVTHDLRRHAQELHDDQVQYVYMVSAAGHLRGVLRLRDLLTRGGERPIEGIMIREPLFAGVAEPLRSLAETFDTKAFLGLPVTDEEGRLLGVVSRAAVREALRERAGSEALKLRGIAAGEELRSMPLWRRARGRLTWLSVNVLLNVLAASVIALYQDTLSAVIALAVFLPIISDMSGCSGSQAVAVSLRELSAGLIKPMDALHVWLKEGGIGIVNGGALGLLIACVAWAWKSSPWLGLVVGVALGVNILVAVSLGGVTPLGFLPCLSWRVRPHRCS